VPMDTIANQVKTMDQDAEYVFICRGGGRSLKVAKYMQQHGFDRVHNYDGGMRGWNGEMTTGEEHVPQTADPKSLQRKT